MIGFSKNIIMMVHCLNACSRPVKRFQMTGACANLTARFGYVHQSHAWHVTVDNQALRPLLSLDLLIQ